MDISSNTSSALGLMAAFCRHQFTDLDSCAASNCLSRDLHWLNSAQGADFLDYEQSVHSLKAEAEETPAPYLLTFNNTYESNYPSGFGTAGGTMLLSGSNGTLSLPINISVCSEDGVQKICSLNMQLPSARLKSPDIFKEEFDVAINCILTSEYKSVIRMDMNTTHCSVLFENGAASLPYDTDYQSYLLNLVNREIVKSDHDRVFEALSPQVLKNRLDSDDLYEVMFDVNAGGGKMQRHIMHFSYIDKAGNIVLITRRDITPMADAEKDANIKMKALLEKAEQANMVKSKFLSRMSHEFHTPLRVILDITSRAEKAKNQKEMASCIEKINNSGRILLEQIDDVLNVNIFDNSPILLRKEPYTFKQFCEHVSLMTRPQAGKKNASFTIDSAAAPSGTMLIDKVRFSRIFFTLLSNAVKFTPIKGKVELHIVELNHKDDISLCRFTVKDNGIGMSEEFLTRLKKFFASDPQSADDEFRSEIMGLWTVKRLTDAMGGTISVESQFGQGTTFTLDFDIQMCGDYSSSITPEGEINLSALTGKHVLICETHQPTADQLISMLESVGMEVSRAANGLEGLTVFNTAPVGYFNVVLTDIRMPIMDGMEFTRYIRSMDRIDSRIIPIIAMTADTYDEDVTPAIESGMTDYLSKPVDREQLYKTLWRAVCLER